MTQAKSMILFAAASAMAIFGGRGQFGPSFGPSAGSDKDDKPVDLDARDRKRQARAARLLRKVTAGSVQPSTVKIVETTHQYKTTVSKTTGKNGPARSAPLLEHRADCARCAADHAKSKRVNGAVN